MGHSNIPQARLTDAIPESLARFVLNVTKAFGIAFGWSILNPEPPVQTPLIPR